jgi:anti-sigma factor RsiW
MNCEEIRELLPLHAGDDLDGAERDRVEEHVALCGACARELDHYREARAALASIREPFPPPGGWRDLRADIQAAAFPPRALRRPLLFDEILRYAALALIGLAVGAAARHLGDRFGGGGPAVVVRPDAVREALPIQPAHDRGFAAAPFEPAPLRPAPPGREPGFHLPQAEVIPAGLEREY